MCTNNNEDLWLGCCLGFRIGRYLSERSDAKTEDLIGILQQISLGDFTLNDPGEDAVKFPDTKEISQNISHSGIRSDKELARQALDQFANQKDE